MRKLTFGIFAPADLDELLDVGYLGRHREGFDVRECREWRNGFSLVAGAGNGNINEFRLWVIELGLAKRKPFNDE